jgi:hypothetical protein
LYLLQHQIPLALVERYKTYPVAPAVAFHPVDISVSLKVFAYNPVGVAGPAGAAAVLIVADCPEQKSYHQYLLQIF